MNERRILYLLYDKSVCHLSYSLTLSLILNSHSCRDRETGDRGTGGQRDGGQRDRGRETRQSELIKSLNPNLNELISLSLCSHSCLETRINSND